MKRYAVDLVIGYIGGYCDFGTMYRTYWFDTLEEAKKFCGKHKPNCTDVFDTYNLPF
jgi:hypothetical protein